MGQLLKTGFKELAHICVLCSAIASPSLLSSSPIRVNPNPLALGRSVTFDESGFQLDMTDGDKNTRPAIAKELSDKGQTHVVKAGGSATVVGGSLASGFAIPAHIIFAVESIQATWTEGVPVSDILDVDKDT